MPKPGQAVRRSSVAPSAKPSPAKPTTPPPRNVEPERYIPRVFECIVHLEQAAAHLKAVGIIPRDLVPVMEGKAELIAKIDAMTKAYKDFWNSLPQHQ